VHLALPNSASFFNLYFVLGRRPSSRVSLVEQNSRLSSVRERAAGRAQHARVPPP
jgi:hypothetical protein